MKSARNISDAPMNILSHARNVISKACAYSWKISVSVARPYLKVSCETKFRKLLNIKFYEYLNLYILL